MWDNSWESITHPKFAVGPHYGWEKTTDIFDVDNYLHTAGEEVGLKEVDYIKWAGWFDLYSKDFYEKLTRIPEDWHGYGGWDCFGMMVSGWAANNGFDFNQYSLTGQIVFAYSVGPLTTDTVNGFSNYYRNLLVKKDVSEQREEFNRNINQYIQQRINELNGK
jgi:hypothetical protein